ncbi:SDR family NAD(P)-dependent oxidoreductase [Bacillus sp. ISL-77]|uniref:SDR family NAD(P)-dependent oxidoreductase n=1 Tax=Bacillus sp. ISL-77 TaxID=2819138 RepID=UPI002035B708|nr:SDR family NAD(P)-dependent oxidoreductase [Bacillus sp. ISL-77]
MSADHPRFQQYAFLETQLEQETNVIDVSITALTVMTKLFLPDIAKRRQGGVLNVASVAAFYPGPLMAVHFATSGAMTEWKCWKN